LLVMLFPYNLLSFEEDYNRKPQSTLFVVLLPKGLLFDEEFYKFAR
jgi:hypothetical protein